MNNAGPYQPLPGPNISRVPTPTNTSVSVWKITTASRNAVSVPSSPPNIFPQMAAVTNITGGFCMNGSPPSCGITQSPLSTM